MELRLCRLCIEELPVKDFPSGKGITTCRPCLKARAEIRRWVNKDSTKLCNTCQLQRPCVDFPKHESTADGYGVQCKACHSELNRMRSLGWSPGEFDEVWEMQEGKCMICKVQLKKMGKGTSADHCHETGKARNILCSQCNLGLGAFGDDPERMRRAALYVELHRIDITKILELVSEAQVQAIIDGA